ncbi:MAG: hypothetical protein DIU52_005375 [bacterium]|jgi:CO/xanthine dehydrogenase Mo-binding subunit|nr:MAG: hypothetical protein DIU52_01160 [bacterium]
MSEQRIEPERYELSEAPRYRSALTRRQFVGAVGAGVVVLVVARDGLSLEAQEPGEAEALGASADPISASLHIGEDGAVTVFTGKVEVGQDIRTSLTQAVAEELGVPPARITLIMGDTDHVPYDAGTFGSRSTPQMGTQLRRAAAAARVGMDPLAFRLRNLRDERLRAVLEAAADRFGWSRWQPRPGRGIGLACGVEEGDYVATCAEVEVDRASGRMRVGRIVEAFECGAIVNPDGLRNQVEGAVVMGLGGALWEAVEFEGGRIPNPGLSQYRLPRFGDVPPIDIVLLDRKDLPSAGAGETPIIAVAPAIGNAIYAAAGVRLRSLPLVPHGLARTAP